MGPTKAKERSLQAQCIEQSSPAPYHRLLYSTSHCQSGHHAEHPSKPSASSKAARFQITARRTPTVPTVSASSQPSRSGPPMWVSFLQHAEAHGTSCVAHPWPVPAAPSERWPFLHPTAPPLHPLWSSCSGHAASQGGLPCFGAIILSFDPADVHAGSYCRAPCRVPGSRCHRVVTPAGR